MNNFFSKAVFFSFLLTIVSGCAKKYESKLAGQYAVEELKLDVPNKFYDSLSLFLFKDGRFAMHINERNIIQGNWTAGDDGDRVWINFYFRGIEASGNIGGDKYNFIFLYDPKRFGMSAVKKISFRRR